MVMPNMGNINAVAHQEAAKPNVFKKGVHLQKEYLHHQAKKAQQAEALKNKQKNEYAAGVNKAVKDSQKNQQRQQAQAKQNARAQAQGVKSGRVAPSAGAAPRTFAMPAGPQGQAQKAHEKASAQAVKTMQQQRNFAHGQAIQMQNQMNRDAAKAQAAHAKTMKSQINTAHGQALKQAPTAKPTQFADTSTKSNAPFPTHEHPAGSSSAILPHLSATETAKTGRPNEFTVGSRRTPSAKSNVAGLGAMGSKLEEGLATKKFPLPEPRKRV